MAIFNPSWYQNFICITNGNENILQGLQRTLNISGNEIRRYFPNNAIKTIDINFKYFDFEWHKGQTLNQHLDIIEERWRYLFANKELKKETINDPYILIKSLEKKVILFGKSTAIFIY